jgi:hypothetical protein
MDIEHAAPAAIVSASNDVDSRRQVTGRRGDARRWRRRRRALSTSHGHSRDQND